MTSGLQQGYLRSSAMLVAFDMEMPLKPSVYAAVAEKVCSRVSLAWDMVTDDKGDSTASEEQIAEQSLVVP